MSDKARIIIVGTGPAGLLSALALASQGQAVALVGPKPVVEDRRTTALMTPSLAILDRLGLLEQLSAGAADLKTMRIVDATSRLVRAPTVTFRASEIDEERFGLNIPNAHMLPILAAAVDAERGIERHESLMAGLEISADKVVARLENGASVDGTLVVAADGRASGAREAASITIRSHALPQAALVTNIGHRSAHSSISTEFHTETGPFTQVPLPGNRSSIVWVVSPATAQQLAALPDDELAMRIETRMQSMLGRVTVEPGRQVYPLSTLSPSCYALNRVALVGEAAHVFPPIGAQGLNLGIRDIEELIDIVETHPDDPGAPAALAAYDRRRRPDILARSGAVNLLNRSLLTDMLPAQLARGAGLAVLGSVSTLRGFFMREGLRPGSGFAALGDAFRKGPALRP